MKNENQDVVEKTVGKKDVGGRKYASRIKEIVTLYLCRTKGYGRV
jgi:hypothetical protein